MAKFLASTKLMEDECSEEISAMDSKLAKIKAEAKYSPKSTRPPIPARTKLPLKQPKEQLKIVRSLSDPILKKTNPLIVRRPYSEQISNSWDWEFFSKKESPINIVENQKIDSFNRKSTYITSHDISEDLSRAHGCTLIKPSNQEGELEVISRNGIPTVVAGSTDKLIHYLADENHPPDQDYVDSFVVTYSYFVTEGEFLNKIMKRFDNSQEVLQLRLMNILKKWLRINYKFLKNDSNFEELLLQKINYLVKKGGNPQKWALDQLQALENSKINTSLNTDKLLKRESIGNKQFSDFSPKNIAIELTQRDTKLFLAIPYKELLHGKFTKRDQSINISNFSQHFNSSASWVVSEILAIQNIKQRANVITRFIEVAKHLFRLRNFSGLMQVIGGLGSTPIYRLKETWKVKIKIK
eukprot:TRINITY_DN223_c0_g1_i14.p2 TRINITY_DN223_c0_g1~~TRINITY_DN223_c0_g1_i14.p2  ORF type:complete len:411 (-),score=67.91 TRINITY_DN223_c0_g1_i14:1898-3130(-)